MPRFFPLLLVLIGCASPRAPAPAGPAAPAPVASAPPSPPAGAGARTPPAAFACTEVIGLTITAEWYAAGFEQLVSDAQFQARTRPHAFVDQWADPTHAAWSEPITSPCAMRSQTPDRVVLVAANWKLTSEDEWTKVLEAFVVTAQQRYPGLRELDLFTVLRGARNQSCGDPKSVVDPMIDAAIANVAAAHPRLVRAAPKLEAPDCSIFENGGPHLTHDGRTRVAELMAKVLTPTQPSAF